MRIVAIEGGIGSGKTTLLEPTIDAINQISDVEWRLIREPVDEDGEFHRLLQQFIANPTDANKRAEFQMYVTRTRHGMLQGIPDGYYVIERSLYSDIVFTLCNMFTTEGPTGEYQASFYDIKEHFKTYPFIDAVVYLDRDPKACMMSAMARDRAGEDAYQIEYFEDLHRFHKAVLPQLTRIHDCKYDVVELGANYADPVIMADRINKLFV